MTAGVPPTGGKAKLIYLAENTAARWAITPSAIAAESANA